MFGGLTKTSSRIAIAAALGMTLGGFAMSATPAKAADLGGDCCADLEERVAELEATTVRKGNKKVSVTLSGWVVKLGSWWDDGHEQNFYVGDKDTTLSSHFQISGSAADRSRLVRRLHDRRRSSGQQLLGRLRREPVQRQRLLWACLVVGTGVINTLLSYMWLKSDRWGTVNWGQLSQATDNVALLPDLSGTVIESNAVVFDGAGMFVRPKGAKNSNDSGERLHLGQRADLLIPMAAVRAPTATAIRRTPSAMTRPTWWGFSASTSYGEDDMWDVAVKYAADWNSIKVSAAAGYTQLTDEGCSAPGAFHGGTDLHQRRGVSVVAARHSRTFGRTASCSRLAHPSCMSRQACSLTACTRTTRKTALRFRNVYFPYRAIGFVGKDGASNETTTWFVKAGIKRAWLPLGATVLFGEWGQYNDMFRGLCGNAAWRSRSAIQTTASASTSFRLALSASGSAKGIALVTSTR